MTESVTVPTANARLVVDAAREAGVDLDRLLALAGTTREAIAAEDARIAYRVVKDLWDGSSELSGDEFFGLHAAERLRLPAFGPLGFAVRSCGTGRQAMELGLFWAGRYFDDTEFRLDVDGPVSVFRHRYRYPEITSLHAADFILGAIVVGSRRFVGVDWTPRRLELRRSPPADDSEYRRVFGIQPSYHAPWNAVSFDTALMDLPLLHADAELLAVLERQVEDFLSKLPRVQELTTQVRSVLARGLRDGDASVESTARALGLTPRTLQRRLSESDTSHRLLLDAVRRDFAQRYLLDSQLSIEQIAQLLGFSEPSAFHRAFRRWTGLTPSEFREQGVADPTSLAG